MMLTFQHAGARVAALTKRKLRNTRNWRLFSLLIPIIFVRLAAQGQTPTPAFEAASIKPAIPLGPLGMRFARSGGPGTHDPGLYRCQNCSLFQIVLEAYGIKLPVKASAPDWLQSVRFDISAKVPEGATEASFHSMLQNLLAARFRLAVHREKKQMQVYELAVAKNGPKFKQSIPKAAPEDQTSPEKMKIDRDGYPILPPGVAMVMTTGHARLRCDNQTMEWFVEMLSSPLGRLVVDATGLKGKYDFVLSWALDQTTSANGGTPTDAADPSGPSLLSAIQSQLGLRLEEKKGLVEVLVIDHIEKVPTEN